MINGFHLCLDYSILSIFLNFSLVIPQLYVTIELGSELDEITSPPG